MTSVNGPKGALPRRIASPGGWGHVRPALVAILPVVLWLVAPAAAGAAPAARGPVTPAWAAAVTAPVPPGAGAPNTESTSVVRCLNTTTCTAVGSFADGAGNTQGVLLTGAAASWTAVASPVPAGASSNPTVAFTGLACPAAGSCAAVGTYDDAVGNIEGLLVTEASGSWSATEAPLPAGAGGGGNPAVNLTSVSCSGAGACVAVGTFIDTNGNAQGLLLTLSGGTWSDLEAPLPAGASAAPNVSLTSVACAAAGSCTAVGSYGDTNGFAQGLLLTLSGGTWTPATAPLPGGAGGGGNPTASITALSCPSATTCSAAGAYFDGSGNTQGMLLNDSAGTWSAVQAPVPSGASTDPLMTPTSLSCTAVNACAAVGTYADASGNTLGLLLVESSGTWSATSAPLPAGADSSQVVGLSSVSCPATGTCTAVGFYTDASADFQGLLLSLSSSTWTPTEAPLPAGAAAEAPVGLASVACASTSSCTVAGQYVNASGTTQGLLLSGAATTWTPTEALAPAGAGGNPDVSLTSVACPATDACVAVGNYVDVSGNLKGLLDTQSGGGTWNAAEAPLPGNAGPNSGVTLTGVSCASTTSCEAVGTYSDSSGNVQGLLLADASGTWTASQAPVPSGAGSNPNVVLAAVACPAAGSCAAVGSYSDSQGNVQGFLLALASGTWKATEAPLPNGADSNPSATLNAVACASAGNCEAVGGYTDVALHTQGVLLALSGGTWAATISPLPAGSGTSPGVALTGLACVSAGNCDAAGTYLDSQGNQQGALLSETIGSWSATQAPLPSNASLSPQVTQLIESCPVAGSCTVGGTYSDVNGDVLGLLLTLSGGGWTALEAPMPTGAATDPFAFLHGIACNATGSCAIAGSYSDQSGLNQGLLLSEASGTWTASQAPLPSDASPDPNAQLNSIACLSNAMCTSVGTYVDANAFLEGMLETSAIPTTTSVSSSVPTPTVGQSVTLTATVSSNLGSPSGTVAFSDGDGTIIGCDAQALSGGNPDTATCVTTFSPAGSYTVTASFGPTATYGSSSGSTTFTVDKASTSTALRLSTATVTYGHEASEVFTATVTGVAGVTDPSGTVAVKSGTTTLCTVTLASGTGTCSPSNAGLAVNSYSVTATYQPGTDPNYNGSGPTTGQTLTVGKATTTTTEKLSTTKLTYGKEASETITATVAGVPGASAPTGIVTVKSGTTTICTITLTSGSGHCVMKNIQVNAGTYKMAATYSGGPDYFASGPTATQTVTIGKGTSSTALKLSTTTVTFGKETVETFTVTVTGAPFGTKPTGSVVVKAGTGLVCTIKLASGTGHCSLGASELAAGTYKIAATYVPGTDPNYLASGPTQAQTLTVLK